MILNDHSFDGNFDVYLADTIDSRQIHYNLRYQVYCDEMGYEDRQRFPEQLEYDDWDVDSVHFIVRHRLTGHWVGALRLVFQRDGVFPFEFWAPPCEALSPAGYSTSIEISRLCVIKEARRFVSKRFAPYGLPDQDIDENRANIRSIFTHKNQSRSIMWGLYRAAADYSAENGIKHWYILVTPALAYFVQKEGFAMHPVGDVCDHRGLRRPYRLDVEHILANPFWRKDFKTHFLCYSALADQEPSGIALVL